MDGVLWVNKITYPVELARAIEIAPANPFVKGAQEFYEQVGYLTPKQRIALSCVMPRRRRRGMRSYRGYQGYQGYTRGGGWVDYDYDDEMLCGQCDGSNWS